MTNTILIFTDAATSPQTHVAVGAFLCLELKDMEKYAAFDMELLTHKLADKIIYTEYQSKKSTWSEIRTVLDALVFVKNNFLQIDKIELFTDCQSLCDLLGRRKEKLEKSNFITRTGKVLQNADLYKELFAATKNLQIQAFKIKGHQSAVHRASLQDRIFSVLDKLSRKKLRSNLQRR